LIDEYYQNNLTSCWAKLLLNIVENHFYTTQCSAATISRWSGHIYNFPVPSFLRLLCTSY